MSLRTWILTVRRYEAGEYVSGVWQEGPSTTFDVRASVQPASPEEMELVPEGRRQHASFSVFTDQYLRPAQTGRSNADIVTINSEEYEVLSCETWQNKILPHYKAIVSRLLYVGD